MKYILIDEYNSEKGEAFGVAFEATEPNLVYLAQIKTRVANKQYGDNADDYRAFSTSIVDRSELSTLEKFDNNHYMERITWAKSNRGLKLLAESATTLPWKTTCAYIDNTGHEVLFNLEDGLVAYYDSVVYVAGLQVRHTVEKDKWFVTDNDDNTLFTSDALEDVKQYLDSRRETAKSQ